MTITDQITEINEVKICAYDDGKSFVHCGRRLAFSESESSVVDSISYDSINASLRIVFRTGRTYDYSNISPATFGLLASAASVGSVVNDLVVRGILKEAVRIA